MENEITDKKDPLLVVFTESERIPLADAEADLFPHLNRKNLQGPIVRRSVSLVLGNPVLRKRLLKQVKADFLKSASVVIAS